MHAESRIGPVVKGVIIGGTIGSVLTFLFTPKNGKELRNDIGKGTREYLDKAKDEGKKLIDEIVSYAEQLRKLSERYAETIYTTQSKRIEREIKRIRFAMNTAIETYRSRGHSYRTPENDNIVNNIYSEFEEERLPKFEGMGRRS